MNHLVPLVVLLGAAAALTHILPEKGMLQTGKRKATQEERRKIVEAVQRLGWPAGEVDRVIARESGWESTARNPQSGAAGLIQFMPRTLAALGFEPGRSDFERSVLFAQLPPLEQLPYILEYFRKVGRPWQKPGDTYLAVFYPSALGTPDSHVIANPGSPVWIQNPALRTTGDGPITSGAVREKGRVA